MAGIEQRVQLSEGQVRLLRDQHGSARGKLAHLLERGGVEDSILIHTTDDGCVNAVRAERLDVLEGARATARPVDRIARVEDCRQRLLSRGSWTRTRYGSGGLREADHTSALEVVET